MSETKRQDTERLILIFESVHFTLKAESLLQENKSTFTLIPVPPSINKGCGLGIQISPDDYKEITDYLKINDIVPLKCVTIT